MPGQQLIAELILSDVTATQKFAGRFAPLLIRGDIVALDGSLGAGKTELCRAIIQALGVTDDVPSPTFTMVQIYEPALDDLMTPPVWHMDMYRLEKPEDALELGMEEAFEAAVSLIEWPSKLGSFLPTGFLTIQLEILTDGRTRKMTLIGGPSWKARLGEILSDD